MDVIANKEFMKYIRYVHPWKTVTATGASPTPAPTPHQGQPCLGFVRMLLAFFLPLFHVIPLWLLSVCWTGDSRMNHVSYQRTTV